jgi:hypothetical protein
MNLTVSRLDEEIERFVKKTSLSRRTEDLRLLVSDSPTQYSEVPKYDVTQIHLKTRKKVDLLRLSILSWYIPDEAIRVLLQLSLREIWDKQEKFSIAKEVLLSSKSYCLAWILQESGWSPSTFFGNVLNRKEVEGLITRLRFFENPRGFVKKYTGYCRGYRDGRRKSSCSLTQEDFPTKSTILLEEARELQFQTSLHLVWIRIERFLETAS